MKMYLQRGFFTRKSTGGLLVVNENIFCFVIEDLVRNGEKVQDETAIPYGIYNVTLSMSNRFGRVMPEILNVPGFTGIRIHSGNTDKDTSGCLLVGEFLVISDNDLRISSSVVAFSRLMSELRKAFEAKEEITIEIVKA
jgi:hypothetical protein